MDMTSDDPPRGYVDETAAAEGECPACGGPLYVWTEAPAFDARRDEEYLIDRCERCGAGIARSSPVHPRSGPKPQAAAEAEVDAWIESGAEGSAQTLRAPNRRSLQAAIGEGNWAALELPERPIQLTRAALEAVLERRSLELERVRTPAFGPNQRWMWQTLLNALTFHPNFVREVRGGRLRPGSGRGRVAFAMDTVVSVLATPLVVLVSFPLEAAAALAGRGGLIEATVVPAKSAAQASSSTISESSSGRSS